MLTHIKEKIGAYRLKKQLKKHFQPDSQQMSKSKEIFLAAYIKAYPVTNSLFGRIPFTKHVLSYSFFSLLALIIIGISAMVYADQTNVGPNHPLYAFKKVNENVQVRLASPEQAPDLHYKLAQRRVSEIKTLQSDTGADTKIKEANIKKLNYELEEEIDNSLSKLDDIDFTDSRKSDANATKEKLCKSIATIIDEHKKAIADYPDMQEDFSGFNKQCSKLLEQNKQ